MRDRIHIRPARPAAVGWAPPPPRRGYDPDFSTPTSCCGDIREPYRHAPPAGAGPAPRVETEDASFGPQGYVGRIFTLAKETVGSLFGSSHKDSEAPANAAPPQLQSQHPQRLTREPMAPPSTTFSGPPRPTDPAAYAPALPADEPAPGPLPPPPVAPTAANPSATLLGRTADATLGTTAAAPHVTVYQFFNTPAEPAAPAPMLWYERYSHMPSRTADMRPSLQYKRQRVQEEEMRALQAPPLRRRERGTPPTPAPARAHSPPQTPAPAPAPFVAEKPPTPPPAVPAAAPSTAAAKAQTLSFTSPAPTAADAPKTTPSVPSQPKPTTASPFSFGGAPALASGHFTATSAPAEPRPAAAAPTNPFLVFSSSSTAPKTTPAAPAAPAPAARGFFKAGPRCVVPEDDGFASGADNSDADEAEKAKASTKPAESTASKPTFSFGAPDAAVSSGMADAKAGSSGSLANPFAFGGGGAKPFAFGAPASSTAAPGTGEPAAAPAVMSTKRPPSNPFGSFRKEGPPAVVPGDDGFASGADSSDDDSRATSSATRVRGETAPATAPAVKPMFSFNLAARSTPSDGSAPPNPFSFGSASSGGVFGKLATDSSGSSASTGTAPTFSFFKKD